MVIEHTFIVLPLNNPSAAKELEPSQVGDYFWDRLIDCYVLVHVCFENGYFAYKKVLDLHPNVRIIQAQVDEIMKRED